MRIALRTTIFSLASTALMAITMSSAWAGDLAARVEAAMNGDHRSLENQARNRYRHPVGTLTFFDIRDGMKVMEITPGGGWYAEIIAPVVRDRGEFIVAAYDTSIEGQPSYRYGSQKVLLDKFAARPDLYDQVRVQPFSPPQSASLGDADSLDLILTFRNVHGWIGSGIADDNFAEFARVLKPGGRLGVVQHRADSGSDSAKTSEGGYVSEEAVIALARSAGLYLEARSEVNANPKDNHGHKSGVWSLPPGLAVCEEIKDDEDRSECEAPYRAIGESDRMTLKFRKPLG